MVAAGHIAPFPLGAGLWQERSQLRTLGEVKSLLEGTPGGWASSSPGHGVGPATRAQQEELRVGTEARWEGPGSLRPWSCWPLDLPVGPRAGGAAGGMHIRPEWGLLSPAAESTSPATSPQLQKPT